MHEFAQDQVQYDNSVSGEDAYEAALIRAGRTQHALILAEAQIISWKRRYVAAESARSEAVDENDKLKRELEKLQAPCPAPPCRLAEGVTRDAEDEGSGAEAGGEADCP